MRAIVAVDEKWGIGRDNGLLFDIPEDMAFFKQTTLGKTIVMGHKTLLSFPEGKPLKRRRNIIMTSLSHLDGCDTAADLDALRNLIKDTAPDDVYIAGGGSIYSLMLPYCEFALVTKIFADGNAQVFFPNLDSEAGWIIEDQSEVKFDGNYHFRFCTYKNLNPKKL